MTDRYAGFTVTIDRDIRSDDAGAIISALKMIKGVVRVDPIESNWTPEVARLQQEIGRKVYDLGLSISRGE